MKHFRKKANCLRLILNLGFVLLITSCQNDIENEINTEEPSTVEEHLKTKSGKLVFSSIQDLTNEF